MKANQIVKEIERFPIDIRIWIIQKTLNSMRKKKATGIMELVAKELLDDYKSDKELTAFTDLDNLVP